MAQNDGSTDHQEAAVAAPVTVVLSEKAEHALRTMAKPGMADRAVESFKHALQNAHDDSHLLRLSCTLIPQVLNFIPIPCKIPRIEMPAFLLDYEGDVITVVGIVDLDLLSTCYRVLEREEIN